ncbi:MAG TPA: SMP-30/gluconolactonase/LRE family protein [Hanamia sp.]|nr:SMP-30/gluconolactonase/LRE family protein [Hanamia sp.]
MKARTLCPSQCFLGESPMWNAERNSCFWVDIDGGILYEYNWSSKKTRNWKFDGKLSLAIQDNKNELILALNTRIIKFGLDSEKVTPITDIDPPGSGNRCNDGACDIRGRLWIGTMHLQHKQNAGALYMVDHNLNVHKKISNTSISNGITWSRDNKRMFYIDSPAKVVQSYHYNEETAEIIFEKNIIEIPNELGSPDGMALDEEGMLWIAHWGGFGVYRWNPKSGQLLDKIEVPVPQVSSCAFAGPDLDHLIITTARENFSEEEARKYPDSGNIFIAKTAVKGVQPYKCSL